MLEWIKSITVPKNKWEKLTPEEKEGKLPTGEFLDINIPEYSKNYQEVCIRAQQGGKDK